MRLVLRTLSTSFLLLVVGLPLLAVAWTALARGPVAAAEAVTSPVARSALWLTLWTAALVAALNAVFGTLTAFVLARHAFPGRGLLSAAVDLPLAIPTVVTGLMLLILYGPQSFLGGLARDAGIRIVFAKPGIVLALSFVTFPFVVRAVEPVLAEIDGAQEEAARTLGASPATTFLTVTLPAILPAVWTGALLCFARAVGEFGSVVLIAGNIPGRTLTAPVHVYGAVESQAPHAASAMSAVLVAVSFTLLFVVDRRRVATRRRMGLEP